MTNTETKTELREQVKLGLDQADILSESTIVINGITIKEMVARWSSESIPNIVKLLWVRDGFCVMEIDGKANPISHTDFIVDFPYEHFNRFENSCRVRVKEQFNKYWGLNNEP